MASGYRAIGRAATKEAERQQAAKDNEKSPVRDRKSFSEGAVQTAGFRPRELLQPNGHYPLVVICQHRRAEHEGVGSC